MRLVSDSAAGALSVEAARYASTREFAASAGSEEVAAYASTRDSAASARWLMLCDATIQSHGDRGINVPYR